MVNQIKYTSANLMGGLGNQMFQIAHSYAQSLRNNSICFFKNDAFTPMQANKPKKYLSNIFRKLSFEDKNITFNVVNEIDWNGPVINENLKESVIFSGYFQSSNNFFDYKNEIKDLFIPTEEFKNKIKKILPEIFYKNSISIHVRRGDYLSIPHVLPTLDISYYKKSLEILSENNNIFIFSDDKEWCKLNFKEEKFKVIEGLEDYEELWAMSLCNHNIIANSSFSWWASFLNLNEDKIIIAPSVWFGPSGPNPHNSIYEKNWEIINVNYDKGILKCY